MAPPVDWILTSQGSVSLPNKSKQWIRAARPFYFVAKSFYKHYGGFSEQIWNHQTMEAQDGDLVRIGTHMV